ncbi:hypothetical protein HFO10_21275, partial [Rhizobium laguerreae]|nr:hypothetical protein [Rhizobium laguerreae]
MPSGCRAWPQQPRRNLMHLSTHNWMALVERSSLLDTVADALEATAEEAEGEGDTRFVANSICVA